MNRRGFLTLLGLAPVAIPTAVKAAAAPRYAPRYATGGYLRGVSGVAGVSNGYRGARGPVDTLTIQVDSSGVDDVIAKLKEAQHMSDFSDDVQRLLPAVDPGPACGIPIEADLTRHKLVYLGSPYTKYEAGLDAAFRDVAAIAAEMMIEGVKVYSPITHGHPLSQYGNVDPLNHDLWLPFDQAMMDAADAMCIADMQGWDTSYGVRYEIDTFRLQGKPVYFRSHSGAVSLYNG